MLKTVMMFSFLALFAAKHAVAELADGRQLEASQSVFNGTNVAPQDRIAETTVKLDIRMKSGEMKDLIVLGCSGTLITPDIIVTASHCLNDVKDPTSTATITIRYQTPNQAMKLITMKDFAIHPESKGLVSPFDVALIRLSQPVKDRQPMPLASTTDFKDGGTLVVAGYGQNDHQGDPKSNILKNQNLKKIMSEIKKQSTDTDAGKKKKALMDLKMIELYNQIISDSLPLVRTTLTGSFDPSLAAGFMKLTSVDHGICQGDSGGPSFVTVNGAYALVGVHSGGAGRCATPMANEYAVDVYVPSVSAWIKKQVQIWNGETAI